MSKPLFSVVIPTYNRAQKLLRGLRSLNDQTFTNFEVLVCDDGSTDDTREIVDNFRTEIKFRQLHYLFGPNWGGPAHPRNRGIKEAAGDWICFLDSDDAWYPTKLENMVSYLGNYDLIYHDFDLVNDSGKPKPLRARQLHQPVFEDLMLKGHNGCIINSGVCVRKSILLKAGGVNEDRMLISVEDADLWLTIARITDRFKHVPKCLGMYFLDGGNITVYNQRMIDKLQYLFDLHAPFLGSDRLKKSAAKTNNYHLARIRQMMGNSKEALKLHQSSLGSPNIKLALRSFYWIFYICWKSMSRSN
jgi:glycosyltransferase involved in cell wall biosynthesis